MERKSFGKDLEEMLSSSIFYKLLPLTTKRLHLSKKTPNGTVDLRNVSNIYFFALIIVKYKTIKSYPKHEQKIF